MADAGLKWVFSAVDNVSETMSKIGKETDKLGASHARLNAASRMIGAGAIIAFGAASVKAYAEAEQQTTRLQVAYARFPAIADRSFESMLKLNDQLQATTGFDNDALAASEAKLAMYKLTGSQIQSLMPLVLDYARAQNIDVVTASTNIGRAFIGNSRALKAIGIDFKNTGNTAADVATVMDALTRTVGGTAEAFGKTTAGQIEITQQSFSDLQEEIGKQLVPALKAVLEIVTPMLGVFSKLPEPTKAVAVGVVALSAAALVAAPRILALKAGLEGAGAAGAAVGKGMGLASKALVVYSLAVAGSSMLAKDASLNTEGLAKALDDMAVSGEAAGAAAKFFGENGATLEENLKWATGTGLGGFDKITYGLGVVESAIGLTATTSNDATAQLKNLDAYLVTLAGSNPKAAAAALQYVRSKADGLNLSVDEVNRLLSGTVTALGGAGGAATSLGDNFNAASRDTADFAKNTLKAVTQADALKFAADGLKAALDALGGKAISTDTATANLYASFRNAKTSIAEAIKDTDEQTDAVTKGGKALDLQTEAGLTAQAALAGIKSNADAMTTSYKEAGRSTEDVTAMQVKAHKEFVAAAIAAGMGAKEAEALAIKYGLIPDSVETAIEASGIDEAKRAVLIYRLSLLDIPPERRTQIVTEWVTEGSKPAHPPIVATPHGPGALNEASGGFISGPGSGTSDSIPAMLSNGEFVVRASSVQRLGVPFLHSLNRYAEGGLVTTGAAALTPAQLLAKFVRDTATAIRLEQGLMKLREDMAAQSRDTKNSVKSFASLTNSFDTKAYATAKADVATARARLNSAATPAERTAALADLDQAQAAARNSKPTAGNVIAGLKAKMNIIKSFGKNLRTLAKNGLPSSFLQQLIDAGPDEGGDLAKALLDSSPAQMKELAAIQRTIDRESGRIGNQRAHSEYDPLISKQRGLVDAAVARAGADRETLTTQVIVKLDGKEVATALAEYKRSIGGRKLGLD